MPVLLAVLSALSSAIGLVVQRDSSRAAPAGMSGSGLLRYLVRQPLWLLGQGAWVVALGLQALALHVGRLSVVQPVLVSELVFVLVIRRLVMHWPVRAAAWGSAALICVSLSLFLVAAEPRGGHPTPTASAWLWALVATGGFAGFMAVLGGRGSPVRRAAFYATAAATLGALEASFLKTATQTLSQHGLLAVFTDWPVYALAIAGAASGVLVQTALRIGPHGLPTAAGRREPVGQRGAQRLALRRTLHRRSRHHLAGRVRVPRHRGGRRPADVDGATARGRVRRRRLRAPPVIRGANGAPSSFRFARPPPRPPGPPPPALGPPVVPPRAGGR